MNLKYNQINARNNKNKYMKIIINDNLNNIDTAIQQTCYIEDLRKYEQIMLITLIKFFKKAKERMGVE